MTAVGDRSQAVCYWIIEARLFYTKVNPITSHLLRRLESVGLVLFESIFSRILSFDWEFAFIIFYQRIALKKLKSYLSTQQWRWHVCVHPIAE